MLGLEGVGVFLAYLLCILSTAVCVVYGIVYWNSPKEEAPKEQEKDVRWEKEDIEIAEKL